jgi:futalosine hydrolase
MKKLLVVAAWEPELERFRALLPRDLAASVVVDAVGIGLVDATLGMTRCISRHSPSHVLLLGTGGAAPGSGLEVGDVVAGSSVRLGDASVVEGRAAMPFGGEPTRLDAAMTAALASSGAREATIVNTLGITTDDALAKTLAALGEVEHLEAYGVARACEAATVPCAIALAVANIVGARGREEWRANHVASSTRAAEIAYSAVAKIRTSTTPRSPA